MKLNKLLQNIYRLFLVVMLGVAVGVPTQTALAQPELTKFPVLSLTGEDGSANSSWYPDMRLVLTKSKDASNLTEILVPVFIKDTLKDAKIYSFDIKLKYDAKVFEPIGIQTVHPNTPDPKYTEFSQRTVEPNLEYSKTVGSYFQYTFHTYKDNPKYDELLSFQGANEDPYSLRVTATSATPMRTTLNPRTGLYIYEPLFYVKMKVKSLPGVGKTGTLQSWLMIDADSIKYNESYSVGSPLYLNVAGHNILEIEKSTDPNRAIGRGALKVIIAEKMPAIEFKMQEIVGEAFKKISSATYDGKTIGTEYAFSDPITVDYKRMGSIPYGYRNIFVNNIINDTRLHEITIESDQPWLQVSTDATKGYPFAFDFDEPAYIPYIDRIMSENIDPSKIGTDGVGLVIKCNPDLLTPVNGEMEGTYVGYLTFRSKDGYAKPVKLKVTFILLRPAYEPDLYPAELLAGEDTTHTGIRININRTDELNKKTLVFGVAPRATAGVDTLMGERAYLEPMTATGFDARWYPVDPAIAQVVTEGFRDALPDYDRPDYNSRDIRSIDDTEQSLTFLCKFHTPRYPLFITWDTSDFPKGAILYLKDYATRGQVISVNMRESAPVPNEQLLSYTFTNATLNSFVIEYTLPKIISFVDATGNPIIRKGWNLLSLPVRPSDPNIDAVYPNSMNRSAIVFYESGWDQTEKDLIVGEGFFLKYNNVVDRTFSGAQITGISPAYGDKIRIYNGWNLIGGLSYPTSVENVDFAERVPFYMPDVQYTKEASYWAYRTDLGYYEVTELRPGLGYFIKAGRYDKADSIEAYLKITPTFKKAFSNTTVNAKTAIYNNSVRLNINDNGQKSTSLYLSDDNTINATRFEMPPVMGENYFDARFANNANLSNTEKSVINLSGIDYPVSISANNVDSDLFFYDAMTNQLLGVIARNSGKNIEIKSTVANKINVEKSNVEFNAFPNPVVNSAKVTYIVPEAGMVTVKLYDALGNEVAELVNTYLNANNYTADLDASALPSGAYMLKVTAGSYSSVRSITVVK